MLRDLPASPTARARSDRCPTTKAGFLRFFRCRDPLQILSQVENGIAPESAVTFLTDGIAAQ
jgi:hypothetical protein